MLGVLVLEGLEQAGIVILCVLGALVAKQCEALGLARSL